MSLVYLAGPITGLSYEGAVDWRESAIAELAKAGICGLSPMRAKAYLSKELSIAADYPKLSLSCAKGITTRDRWDCQRADVVLVNLRDADRVSIGTVMELGWGDAYGVPIVLIMEPNGNLHDHPMVREVAGFTVGTLEEGLAVVRALLCGDQVRIQYTWEPAGPSLQDIHAYEDSQ